MSTGSVPPRRLPRLLAVAAPAELAAVHDRGARRRHLGVLALDLAARGHLAVADDGSDRLAGEALDWVLTVRAPSSSPGDELRPHERAFLDLVAAVPSGLLSRVRAHEDAPGVLTALRDDVGGRGWLHHHAGVSARSDDGRALHRELRALRRWLGSDVTRPDLTAELLPVARAVHLDALWQARLGQQRPPTPAWFTPGPERRARGWLGLCSAADALSVPPPPGGGAGSSTATGSGWALPLG